MSTKSPAVSRNSITFFVPGSRHYDNGSYSNTRKSFVNISITGTKCQCNCAHCNGRLLTNMMSVASPKELEILAANLAVQGCKGVLISGGACSDGSVPLLPFGEALQRLAEMGIEVVVHPGLLNRATAKMLSQAKVARVALDLIGDDETIKKVYHLDKTTDHYRESLEAARSAGLKVSPHIVAGLHFGQIKGENEALNMIADLGAHSLVLVVLMPMRGTAMANIEPPAIAKVDKLFRTAREKLPDIPISLGCARPVGEYARLVERAALEAGFNGIAYPARETVDAAVRQGLVIAYQEVCCGII